MNREKSEVISILAKRLNKTVVKYWQYYLLILPALISILVFHYIPIYGVQIAFKNFVPSKGIWGSPWVGLKHFQRFFNGYYFGRLLSNTLLIGLYQLALFPVSIILALSMNEVGNLRYKKVVQTVTYAPHFISTVVIVSMVMCFFQTNGIFGQLVELLGGTRMNYMGEAKYFKSIYVLSGKWQDMGWGAIIYLGALSGVDLSLHEAAQIDGASRIQRIIHINLPAIAPTVTLMMILQLGSVMSVGYEKIYLMQNPLNMSASDVISTYVYRVGLADAQYSFSSAVGLFNSLINLILLCSANFFAGRLTGNSLW